MISPTLFPAISVTVVRNRKMCTALITNQIAGLVPYWEKIKQFIIWKLITFLYTCKLGYLKIVMLQNILLMVTYFIAELRSGHQVEPHTHIGN